MIHSHDRLDHANLGPMHWARASDTEVTLLIGWRWDHWAFWDEDAKVHEPGCGVELAVDGVDLEWIVWVWI